MVLSQALHDVGHGEAASKSKQRSKTTATNTNINALRVNILLVDDDVTCLSIISSLLRTCYSLDKRSVELVVFPVPGPLQALAALRNEKKEIDLVVTDLHMPVMNGFELQKRVNAEFKLPVVIMSSDDKESVMLDSLKNGAIFYLMKPIKKSDLRTVWQYAISSKKSRTVLVEEDSKRSTDSSIERLLSCEDIVSDDNNEDKGHPVNKKRHRDDDNNDHEADKVGHPPPQKKGKVVWSTSLHNRFLEAINHIGLDGAVPKKILEFMNVPGLTRENVASHLQKYRLFLKKVADRSANVPSQIRERALKSNFAMGCNASLPQNFSTSNYPHQNCGKELQMTTPSLSYSGNFEGNFSTLESSNFSAVGFPGHDHKASGSRNHVPAHGNGQSSLLGNPNGYHRQHQSMLENFDDAVASSDKSNHLAYQQCIAGSSSGPSSYGGIQPFGTMNATDHGRLINSQPQDQARTNLDGGSISPRGMGRGPLYVGSCSTELSQPRSSPCTTVGNLGLTNQANNKKQPYFTDWNAQEGSSSFTKTKNRLPLLDKGATTPENQNSLQMLRQPPAIQSQEQGQLSGGLQNLPNVYNWNTAQEGSSSFLENANQLPLLDIGARYLENETSSVVPPAPPAAQPQEQGQEQFCFKDGGGNNDIASAFDGKPNYDQLADIAETELGHTLFDPTYFATLDDEQPFIEQQQQQEGEAEGAMDIFPNNSLDVEACLLIDQFLNDDLTYLHVDHHGKPSDQEQAMENYQPNGIDTIAPVIENGAAGNQDWDLDVLLNSAIGNGDGLCRGIGNNWELASKL